MNDFFPVGNVKNVKKWFSPVDIRDNLGLSTKNRRDFEG
jgi:hypothetical protein